MGRAQGIALALAAIALVGHLTLGGRARWLAEQAVPPREEEGAAPTPSSSSSGESATRPAMRPRLQAV